MFVSLLLLCALAAPETPAAVPALQAALETPLLEEKTVENEVGAFVRAHIPKLELPANSTAWDQEQGRLRQDFLEKLVFRGVPEAWRTGDVRVEWGAVLHPAQEYEIRKLRYEALPGLWIPAVVYMPAALQGKTVAVLNVNGHVGPLGKAFEEEQLRCINLAKRGIIAFHPEWLSFGELQGEGYNHNRLAYLDLIGTSGLSVFYLELKRALDVIESMQEVDIKRIGMTGLSGGGWQTILFSALDTRIACAAPNAGYIGITERTDHPSDIGDLEQVPADMLKIGDYTHLTAMLAPRPALIILNAKDNCCFEAAHTVPVVYDAHVPWYGLYNAQPAFQVHVNEDPGTHNYGKDNRQTYYQFAKTYLMPEAAWDAEDIDVQAELQTQEQLQVGLPPHNEDFITLATALYEKLPRPQVLPPDSAELAAWKDQQRKALRDVLALDLLEKMPAQFEVTPLEESQKGELRLQRMRLRMNGWTVPAVAASAGNTAPTVAVILTDEGLASAASQIQALAPQYGHVAAIDLTFLGHAKPAGNAYQYPMLLNATGARALGLQVAELLWIADYGKKQMGLTTVIHATGWNTSTAALMAAALAPDLIKVVQQDAPESLFQLVQDKISYNDKTPLFVFGLLPNFDVPVLKALAS